MSKAITVEDYVRVFKEVITTVIRDSNSDIATIDNAADALHTAGEKLFGTKEYIEALGNHADFALTKFYKGDK